MLAFFGENSVANASVLQWKYSLNGFSWKQLDEASFLTFPPTEDRHIGSKSTVRQVFGFLFFLYLLSSQTPTTLQRLTFDLKRKSKPVKVMFERAATEGLGGLIWIQGCSAETEQFKPFVLV